MKKILLLVAALFTISATAFGQAKKPTIMVVPSPIFLMVSNFSDMG